VLINVNFSAFVESSSISGVALPPNKIRIKIELMASYISGESKSSGWIKGSEITITYMCDFQLLIYTSNNN
jgi:hypothetical protein